MSVTMNSRHIWVVRMICCLALVKCAFSAAIPQRDAEIPSTSAPLEDQADPNRLKRYAKLGLHETPVQKTQHFSNVHPDARATPYRRSKGSNGSGPSQAQNLSLMGIDVHNQDSDEPGSMPPKTRMENPTPQRAASIIQKHSSTNSATRLAPIQATESSRGGQGAAGAAQDGTASPNMTSATGDPLVSNVRSRNVLPPVTEARRGYAMPAAEDLRMNAAATASRQDRMSIPRENFITTSPGGANGYPSSSSNVAEGAATGAAVLSTGHVERGNAGRTSTGVTNVSPPSPVLSDEGVPAVRNEAFLSNAPSVRVHDSASGTGPMQGVIVSQSSHASNAAVPVKKGSFTQSVAGATRAAASGVADTANSWNGMYTAFSPGVVG